MTGTLTPEQRLAAKAYEIIFGKEATMVCKCPNFVRCAMKPILTASQMEELQNLAENGGEASEGLKQALKKFANANGGLFIHTFRWTREEAIEAAAMYEQIEKEYYALACQSSDRRDWFLDFANGASKVAGDLKAYAKWLT